MMHVDSSENADPHEIAKFNDSAHHWWDPAGEFKLLHELNPLRLAWITQHLDLAGKRVLDVGCGGGILAESMARMGAVVTGIDLAEKGIQVAKLHGLESGISVHYKLMSAQECAAQYAAQYDVVTCMEMLEHVPDPAIVVQSCGQLVKPGGSVFFSTINRNIKAYLLAILGAEYVLRLVPRGTHDYAKLIQPAELARYARQASLDVQQIIGMHYNPITSRFTLGGKPDVNYFLACKKI
ncbi:MAG: bifunctional 2-polyprenyl-6-hydroxyphenol methylase/3-demethylubiquinol 3-O-methyltransferase UbiG [Ottowia sp.]|nr:bifunctional 2-polyprenyl-6-hydroxyphenol methylase/3-demethylubiquinol 3-O-methyltransferase UbiG [Ottowia sp.]